MMIPRRIYKSFDITYTVVTHPGLLYYYTDDIHMNVLTYTSAHSRLAKETAQVTMWLRELGLEMPPSTINLFIFSTTAVYYHIYARGDHNAAIIVL